jgi:tRNA(Phe) wybutosine-synthesizing methylase Tyw3
VKPSLTPEHPSKSIYLKRCDIDVELVDIVTWINAHPDALTLASCQGTEVVPTEADPEGRRDTLVTQQPYIMWICHDQFQLTNIVRSIKGETEVKWNSPRGCLIYVTRWKSTTRLRETTKILNHFGIVVE